MDAPRITRKYESMFLIDNTHANKDWDGVVKHVHEILQKHGAEIVTTEKWGERKLAYKVKGQKRGTYMLTRFNAPTDAISPIKQRCLHSDVILRNLIVRDLGVAVPPLEGAEEVAVTSEVVEPHVTEEQEALAEVECEETT